MEGYAVRITLAYNALPNVLEKWHDICEQIIVYEHPAPPANRQHCHLLIVNPKVTSKTFKDRSGLGNGGNAFWSWKNLKPKTRASALLYCRYMSKGIYDPKYQHGQITHISPEELAVEKANWVQYNSKVMTRSKSHKAYLAWLEEWGKHPHCGIVEKALAVENINNTHEIYINMVRRHAELWLVGENEGFYNQKVANQKINLVRSYLYEIKYSP